MKKTVIALVFMAAVSTAAMAQQNVSIVESQNYIEVNGYNRAEVAPDEIYIEFRIDESDARGRASINDQEARMLRALQDLGIDIGDRLTVKDMSSNFKKYILRRTDIQQTRDYQLKVADAQTAASVFGALEGVGISNASITKARYSKIDEFVLDNKVKAVKNAQQKASQLAMAVGQKIGPAIFIQDYERSFQPYTANTMTRKAVMASGVNAEALPEVEFEKITVESNVTVRFLLE